MLRKRIRNHQLAVFVCIAFGWAWTWDALYYLFDWGASLPVNLGRQWGVPVAAIVSIWASDVPFRTWIKRVLDWRVHPGLYLIAILIPLFIDELQPVVRALGGGSLTYSPPAPLPVIVLFVLAQMVLFGGLEEIGWRGFLQPRLQERTSVLTAGLAIGVLWWIWHLPLFIGHRNYVLEPRPFLTYTLFVIGASCVFGAFVNVTDGRVLPLMVMHAVSNLGNILAGSGGVLDGSQWISLVVGSGMWWLLVAVLVLLYGREMVPQARVKPVS